MKFRNSIIRIATAAALLTSLAAFASPITFIYSGSGSGTLDGTAFATTDFTITATADTTNRQACFNAFCFTIDHTTATIDIAGLGNFGLITGTRTFFNDRIDSIGLSRNDVYGNDLFDSASNAALDGYDLISSLGPISGLFTLLQWDGSAFGEVVTTAGVLQFETSRGDGSFQAITSNDVPEPSLLALVCIALAGLIATRRGRQ